MRKQKIQKLLLEMGFSPNLSGFEYLTDAIEMVVENNASLKGITTLIYPAIAKKNFVSDKSVERAIRYSIENAANTRGTLMEERLKLPVNMRTCRYTNGEFIAAAALSVSLEEENES